MFVQEVTSKMLEIVEVVRLEIQREMITCLPEVVDDAEHNVVAHDLQYVNFQLHLSAVSVGIGIFLIQTQQKLL